MALLAALATLTLTPREFGGVSLPRGAQRVTMHTITMRADCAGTVTVEEVRLRHRGMGLSSDIAAVYAEESGRRLSDAATFSRQGLVVLRLRRFMVPACTFRTVSILVDLAEDAEAGGEHRIELAEDSPVAASGAQVVVAPSQRIELPLRTAAQGTGTVEVGYLRLLKPVRYGKDRAILRMTLTARGQRDLGMQRMVLTNAGSARTMDLRNLFLVDGRGNRVSSVAPHMVDDRVTLEFNPVYMLPRSTLKRVELHADVLASRRKTIHFSVEEPGDMTVGEVRSVR
jgi:hypothetical protein